MNALMMPITTVMQMPDVRTPKARIDAFVIQAMKAVASHAKVGL